MGLQAYRQHLGKHLDEQSRVQTMTLSLHRTNTEDGFEDLPETFNQMMLLPNVPDFCAPHRGLTHRYGLKESTTGLDDLTS
jgi:hypothetical protein